jgi:hypothetical protein
MGESQMYKVESEFSEMPLLKYMILLWLLVLRLQTETKEVDIKLSGRRNAASREQGTRVVQ